MSIFYNKTVKRKKGCGEAQKYGFLNLPRYFHIIVRLRNQLDRGKNSSDQNGVIG